MTKLGLVMAAVAIGCGGAKKPVAEGPPPGESHVTDADAVAVAAAEPVDAGAPEPPPPPPIDAGPPPPPYTFSLENPEATDVTFAIDKGWQPVIFAYTGKPPKAKSVLLFPTFCTESCEADPKAMCPICREPVEPKDRQKHEKAETKREVAPAGGKFELAWDGKVFAYEKAPKEARGKKRKCQCWRKVDPPADTYTIKACGLRPAEKVGGGSRFVCAETQVALPAPTTPTTISLKFPK
jgi:hypothetical protein